MVEEGKRSSYTLHSRRGAYKVADDLSFSRPLHLNEDFKRLCTSGLSSKTSVSVPLDDIVHMEASLAAQQEAQSFALWILSTVFTYVSGMELDPEDADLFRNLSSSYVWPWFSRLRPPLACLLF